MSLISTGSISLDSTFKGTVLNIKWGIIDVLAQEEQGTLFLLSLKNVDKS
jgi:hypothetical protein